MKTGAQGRRGAQPASLCAILSRCPRGDNRWLAAPPRQKPLCSGPGCPDLPPSLASKGPCRKSASPSNAIVCSAPPMEFTNSTAAALKSRLPQFSSLWCLKRWLSLHLALSCTSAPHFRPPPIVLLSTSAAAASPCRAGEGCPLQLRRGPPFVPPPTLPPQSAQTREGAGIGWVGEFLLQIQLADAEVPQSQLASLLAMGRTFAFLFDKIKTTEILPLLKS